MTRLTRTILKLLAGASILALVLQFVDVRETARALQQAKPGWIAAAVACFIATRVLMAVKWWILLGGRQASISYPTVQRAVCLSDYYALLFPNTLAIDTTRVILLRHTREGVGFTAAAIVADRIINISTTAVVALLALITTYTIVGEVPFSKVITYSLLAVVLPLLGACLIVGSRRAMLIAVDFLRMLSRGFPGMPRIPRVLDAVQRAHGAMSTMLTSSRTVGPTTALACLVVFARVSVIFFLFKAIGAPQAFLLCLTLVPAITLVTLLPISIFGLGVKDGAFVLLFGGAGAATSHALGVSFISYFVVIGANLTLGILASMLGPPLPRAREAENAISENPNNGNGRHK